MSKLSKRPPLSGPSKPKENRPRGDGISETAAVFLQLLSLALAVAVIALHTSAEGTANVHAKIRWTAVVLTLLSAVLILAVFGGKAPDIPRKLPAISSEAQPLRAVAASPLEIRGEPSRFYPVEPTRVQTVSHNVPVAVRLPLVLGADDQRVKLVHVKDDVAGDGQPQHLIWTEEHWGDNKPIYVRSRDIRFKFENSGNLKILVNDTELLDQSGEYRHQLAPGTNELKITVNNGATSTVEPASLTIHAPDEDRVRAPSITHVANGKNADLVRVPVPPSPVSLYGRPNVYLRIVGQNYPSEGRLTFLHTVGQPGQQKLEEISDSMYQLQRLEAGAWSSELRLPATIPNSGYIFVRSTSKGSHNYSKALEYAIPTPLTLTKELSISNVLRKETDREVEVERRSDSQQYPINQKTIYLQVTLEEDFPKDSQVVIYRGNETDKVLGKDVIGGAPESSPRMIRVQGLNEGIQQLRARIEQGDQQPLSTANGGKAVSDPITLVVRTSGPKVERVVPQDFGTAPGVRAFVIHFTPANPLDLDANLTKLRKVIEVRRSMGSGSFERGGDEVVASYDDSSPSFDPQNNTITVRLTNVQADLYQLTVKGEEVKDIFGNHLEGVPGRPGSDYVTVLGRTPPEAELLQQPSIRPGIAGATGEYVPFPEFTRPRKVSDGFNPHDKVETRVVRLYYYRDAHRVAQIINRKVKSHNRQGVDTSRQLADKARSIADQASEARREAERAAILKAQETRRIETQLHAAEQGLNRSIQELTNARRQGAEAGDPVIVSLEATVRRFSEQVDSLRTSVQNARGDEQRATEVATDLEGKERLAREEQFRREVAAAHADPDTYAAGQPKSQDPVEQVSISVIGEGLIHLRGPLKGINTIRTMIDQIDQPAGQVRVAVHTVQINGEEQNRMEDVANIIQMYLDHSRFLTMQSSEMLRKAVVQVASRKAEEAMSLYPGESQRDRDRRYLDAFFGREFIDELEAMDSEFLRSGNKILSLHSMDTTSLSSALNLLALAKNSTRLEILSEFEQMTQGELPAAEAIYMEAAMTVCQQKWSMRHPPKFYPMAQRAVFQSLKGFFDAQIAHDETLTPLQREFIRLAQIFKSRLITELEYKQRVMERAVIEERGGDREKELQDAREKEDMANTALAKAEESVRTAQRNLQTVAQKVQTSVQDPLEQARQAKQAAHDAKDRIVSLIKSFETVILPEAELATIRRNERKEIVDAYQEAYDEGWKNILAPLGAVDDLGQRLIKYRDAVIKADKMRDPYLEDMPGTIQLTLTIDKRTIGIEVDPHGKIRVPKREDEDLLRNEARTLLTKAGRIRSALSRFALTEVTAASRSRADEILDKLTDIRLDTAEGSQLIHILHRCMTMFDHYGHVAEEVLATVQGPIADLTDVVARIGAEGASVGDLFVQWIGAERGILDAVREILQEQLNPEFKRAREAFHTVLTTNQAYLDARALAENSRRPLDHKKFLDMLIDDLEEKYIELLDGTRAHTANVDSYLKRLTTALDDDFNTQFYFPAFRYIREASTHWDVQFGQVETTSILTNNRAFGKVDPSASMEFDLPARSIAIAEALNGAKAVIDDVGALANDPTFLALASSGVAAPANVAPGAAGGFGVVRDVLPGLDSTTAEQIMAHNAGARPQFGSNLENLIPDPAIYKFETGTGYEIRPVIQPDGQAVVFDFNYMYTTQIREPVRADEKHLGRVKRHFINTDVQLSNFELREVSRYTVALKASRTSRGVPMLENIPIAGVLFRPLPSAESSLQQNLIYSQATIFPTLFDLMGLRWAPAVADLDALRVTNREFVVRGRHRSLENRVYDYASEQVDEFLRIPQGNRRADLYRSQETIPYQHPNGYQGPGLDLHDSPMQEGYRPEEVYPPSQFTPSQSPDGALDASGRSSAAGPSSRRSTLEILPPGEPDPRPALEPPAVQWREQ
jgi:hypothetical protein